MKMKGDTNEKKRFNALCGPKESDHKFLVEIIAQICDYAIDNGMNPTDTIMVIANNMLLLTEISNFDNWERRDTERK